MATKAPTSSDSDFATIHSIYDYVDYALRNWHSGVVNYSYDNHDSTLQPSGFKKLDMGLGH